MNGGSEPFKPYRFLKECDENFQMHIGKLLNRLSSFFPALTVSNIHFCIENS